MKCKGIGTSPGVALGRLRLYHPQETAVSRGLIAPEETEGEIASFLAARSEAITRADWALERLEGASRDIMLAQRDMLSDEAIRDAVTEQIRSELICGPLAVQTTLEKYRSRLLRSKNERMRERAADLEDVCRQLLRAYVPEDDRVSEEEPVVIAAIDLLPSDTARLDFSLVKGIITEVGGMTSHSSIIARSHGIPEVTGISDLLRVARDGQAVILDADQGLVIFDPGEEEWNAYKDIPAQQKEEKRRDEEFLARPCLTANGEPIAVGANIGSDRPEELARCESADMIGLFRSEFLYMEKSAFPTEEEQFQAYRRVLEAFAPRPVTLRTLDIGGDKSLPYFPLPKEDNPFLGVRALRLGLQHPEIFRTQLRAALRASVYGVLWIMIPMVGSLEDVRSARAAVEETRAQLEREGIPVSPNVQFGVMIEIPSLAMMADRVAEEVDFASLGTNDLCQYLLAADRMNPAVQSYYQKYHPALFRLIEQTARCFLERGKPLSLCGELGGDEAAVAALVGLGVKKLSMNPSAMGRVKRRLAAMASSEMVQLARAVCNCSTAGEVETLLRAEMEAHPMP